VRRRACVRAAAAALCAGAGLTACAHPSRGDLSASDRLQLVKDSATAPRVIHVENDSGPEKDVWDATVEDDYRYSASYTFNGMPQYEEVDYDDARLVRLEPTSVFAQRRPDGGGPPVTPGQWVNDLDQAPSDFLSQTAPPHFLDPRGALDIVHGFDDFDDTTAVYTPAVTRATKWDPKSQLYVKKDDKFAGHREAGTRYDTIRPPYTSSAIFNNGIPPDYARQIINAFEFTSFWFKDGRVTRIEELFQPDVPRLRRDLQDEAKRMARDTGVSIRQIRLPGIPSAFHKVFTFTYKPEVKVVVPTASGGVKLSGFSLVGTPISPTGPSRPGGGTTPPTVPGLPGGATLSSGQAPSTSTTRRSP
jgi:hypothetical protein